MLDVSEHGCVFSELKTKFNFNTKNREPAGEKLESVGCGKRGVAEGRYKVEVRN